MSETELVKAFLLKVPQVLPDVLVFDRPIRNVQVTARGNTWRERIGVPGQCDCYVVARGGRHVELEMKAATGRLETLQKAWRARCLELGIPHLVLRAKKGETAGETVARWVMDLSDALYEQDWRHFPPDCYYSPLLDGAKPHPDATPMPEYLANGGGGTCDMGLSSGDIDDATLAAFTKATKP